MKERKKIIIFFVVFVAIATLLLVLFLNSSKNATQVVEDAKKVQEQKQKQLEETKKKMIFGFDRDKISVVKITYNNNTFTFSRGSDKKLRLSDPSDIQEDPSYISVMSIFLGNLTAKKYVTDKPTSDNIWDYGLGRPSVCVATYVDGEEEKVFYIGNKLPDENLYYVKKANTNDIYAISGILAKEFMLDRDKIRDKSIFKLGGDTINSITVKKNAAVLYGLKRENDGGFAVTQPILTKADSDKAIVAIQVVAGMKLLSEVPQDGDLAKYGLSSPLYNIDFLTSSGKSYSLAIGKEKKIGAEAYAKVSGRNGILVIDESKLNHIDVAASALVDGNMYEVPKGERVVEFRATRNGKSGSIRFDASKGEIAYVNGAKTQKTDDIKLFESNNSKFTASIVRLDGAQAGNPEIAMTFVSSGGKVENISFIPSATEDLYYVVRGGGYTGLIISKKDFEERFKTAFKIIGV